MKSLIAPALLTAAFLATSLSPGEPAKQIVPLPAPAATGNPKAVARKINVRIITSDGTTSSEVSVPGFETGYGQMGTTVCLYSGENANAPETVGIETFNYGDDGAAPVMKITVVSLEQATLVNISGGSTSVNASRTLFEVTTPYSGPGDYEVYRNQTERMVVTVK